jgi:hypothetical protein
VTSQDLKPENYEQQDVRPAHQTEMDSQMADHPILIAKLGKNQELACRCVAKKVTFPFCYFQAILFLFNALHYSITF